LKNGIALVPWTRTKQELKCIKKWCDRLSIDYKIVTVNRTFDSYCIKHTEIVPEDYPCPQYWYNKDCYVEYDYQMKQKKIILHDKQHSGTFQELDFEWDDRYVDGGYVPLS
jgi:hypothetical protein